MNTACDPNYTFSIDNHTMYFDLNIPIPTPIASQVQQTKKGKQKRTEQENPEKKIAYEDDSRKEMRTQAGVEGISQLPIIVRLEHHLAVLRDALKRRGHPSTISIAACAPAHWAM